MVFDTDSATGPYPIAELRDYTLEPGQRDALIDVFERHLIETQEDVGMAVLAHFRDLDRPDRFVWFRGFPSMEARGESLPAFYLHGEAWRTHRDTANATMIDSDNVLLLREAWSGAGLTGAGARPPVGAAGEDKIRILVTTYSFASPVDAGSLELLRERLLPAARAAGARPLAAYASEYAQNNFPRLPVREGEHVFVWVAAFAGADAYGRYRIALRDSTAWRDAQSELAWRLSKPAEERRLVPAARSRALGD
ncbi:NIPSNAP family protein [Luteimonas gilva]|uniref:NIPSNAP family protein n=1 Tax=Luteimonas gilva TaxID=2572684 RepID=A0A4U5JN20_9GAMM|nr:NIPSNAP family protein [Luteimonas gilva]TKR30166.1 NIPSNAP family protein [Luteimonas gilva]